MSVQKKQTLQVREGRARYVCAQCRTKTFITIRSNEKQRNIICRLCKSTCCCVFNRRCTVREPQQGRATLKIDQARIMSIQLRDVSCYGVGFHVPRGQGRSLSVGQELKGITCDWNLKFPRRQLVVQNITGDAIGARFIGVHTIV